MSPNDIINLVMLILLGAVASASETALVSISRFKVRLLLKKNAIGSISLQKLKDNPHRMLTTLLICNNLANISASVYATSLAMKIFASNALAYATGVMTFMILVFGEIIPKNFATNHYEKIALLTAPFVNLLCTLLAPIVIVFDFITVKIFRVQPVKPKITEEEIRNIVDIAREEGGITKEEKEMIHRIFKFDDIDVGEIRVPRVDMVTLNTKHKLSDALELIKINKHSRLPVYEGNKDNIVGIFYFKDALYYIINKKFNTPVERLMRKPLFIPKTKKLNETLKLFQKKKQHMAIIVNEYGGVSGLVTIEDILEEIVGEIGDETDKVEPEIQKLDKNVYRVVGKADIDEVNKKLKLNLKTKGDFDTLSGYIMAKLGRIPDEEEEIELDSVKMTINRVEANRIIDVIVKKK